MQHQICIDAWYVSKRKAIPTLKTEVFLPPADGRTNFSKTASAWKQVLDDTVRKGRVRGHDAPVFTKYGDRFGVRTITSTSVELFLQQAHMHVSFFCLTGSALAAVDRYVLNCSMRSR